MLDTIQKFIKQKNIAGTSQTAIVGLSGGLDSVALTHILVTLGYKVLAVHCNFHLRGAESDRDEQFVRNFCKRLDIKLHVENFDTTVYAAKNKISIEMAARDLRYELFERVRLQTPNSEIFIAHHSDDSIETALLNLLRGTGLKGMCGIAPVNGHIMRPLLCVSRKDLEQYAHDNNLGYVIDSTNLHNDYMRNKIRNVLVPMMEEIRPGFKSTMLVNMENFGRAQEIYSAGIDNALSDIVRQEGSSQIADADKLFALPYAETLLHHWLAPFGFNPAQTRQICENPDAETGTVYLSATHRLLRTGKFYVLQAKSNTDNSHESAPSAGENFDLEKYLSIETSEQWTITPDKNIAYTDTVKLGSKLVLRLWREGDKFYPIGMNGRAKKVSDFLSDIKVPAAERKQVMVLCSDDKIVWVVGFRLDERFKISSDTKSATVFIIR